MTMPTRRKIESVIGYTSGLTDAVASPKSAPETPAYAALIPKASVL